MHRCGVWFRKSQYDVMSTFASIRIWTQQPFLDSIIIYDNDKPSKRNNSNLSLYMLGATQSNDATS